jgi:hypothetical protein
MNFEKTADTVDDELNFIHTILSNEMMTNGFPLIYKGELNHQITKLFTSMAEQKISQTNKEKTLRMKVFHIMVECLQNINKHSDDYDDPVNRIGNGLFFVGEKEDSYYVVTGNKINNDKVESLKRRIDTLNKLKREELSDLHKNQMQYGFLTERGGAGLGLIDIVRKTGEKLIYHFSRIDDTSQFFLLKVTIGTKSNN